MMTSISPTNSLILLSFIGETPNSVLQFFVTPPQVVIMYKQDCKSQLWMLNLKFTLVSVQFYTFDKYIVMKSPW